MAVSVLFGMLALVSSCALAVASAYLVVRWSKKPLLWLLAPLFVFVWLAVAVVPIAGYMLVVNLDSFRNEVTLVGSVPDPDEHTGRYGILLEPLRAGGIGSTVVAGEPRP